MHGILPRLSPQHKRGLLAIFIALAASLAFGFLCAAPAVAQVKVTFAPKTGRIEGLTPVMAQAARCAAISEAHGLLAFGHDKDVPGAHVPLARLGGKGNPAAYAIPLLLPRPKGLEKAPQYATGVAFHPKL